MSNKQTNSIKLADLILLNPKVTYCYRYAIDSVAYHEVMPSQALWDLSVDRPDLDVAPCGGGEICLWEGSSLVWHPDAGERACLRTQGVKVPALYNHPSSCDYRDYWYLQAIAGAN